MAEEDKWQPSEEQVEEIMRRFTHRQCAIAYLRARRGKKQSDTAFEVLDRLTDLQQRLQGRRH